MTHTFGTASCQDCHQPFTRHSGNQRFCYPCSALRQEARRARYVLECRARRRTERDPEFVIEDLPAVPDHLLAEHRWLCDNPLAPGWQERHARYLKALAKSNAAKALEPPPCHTNLDLIAEAVACDTMHPGVIEAIAERRNWRGGYQPNFLRRVLRGEYP